jgi:hypothetical protein
LFAALEKPVDLGAQVRNRSMSSQVETNASGVPGKEFQAVCKHLQP